jgi:hypothetical protein
MSDAEEREELLVLTRGWDEAARAAFMSSYSGFRADGAPHEEALMRALGGLLP